MGKITNIGDHRVRHGDMQDDLTELMGDDKADLIYTDPPWGIRLLKFFQTQNLKQTGTPVQEVDLEKFQGRLFDHIMKYANGFVVIEYGQEWRDQVLYDANERGLLHLGTASPTYKSGGKDYAMDVHVFIVADSGRVLPSEEYYAGIAATKGGIKTCEAVVGPLATPGGILLDPLCGMGLQARTALKFGMRFRGNELNEVRLAKTIMHLERGRV